MGTKILKIHPEDDLIVALTHLVEDELIRFEKEEYRLLQDVPEKHKFATRFLSPGDPVRMYGSLVGKATRSIKRGELITTDNIFHAASEFTATRKSYRWKAPNVSKWLNNRFLGYHRSDGKVGTANYWLVIPLVFCENRNIEILKDALLDELGYGRKTTYRHLTRSLVKTYRAGKKVENIPFATEPEAVRSSPTRVFPNIDGIKFLEHTAGCGESRQDSETLCRLLAAYINHPNVAGATVLSLGCQNAEVRILEEAISLQSPHFNKPLYRLDHQYVGLADELVTEAIHRTFAGLVEANKNTRKPAPLNQLVVGVECGGSDGFSGISANPAIGHAADLLVALGGSVILGEFPELCGVEQDLLDRCVDKNTADRFVSIQHAYAARALADGSALYMNPSPGNIKNGLITDAMKSAGAARKGGSSPVVDVLDYPEMVTRPGLNLLCTPGGDVESTTGLAGAGANLLLFSTGLGTPTGNPVVPVIKVSSNSRLARHMSDIIDLDIGTIITGAESIKSAGERILDYCIQVAGGKETPKAVQRGQDDFIPWKRGISL